MREEIIPLAHADRGAGKHRACTSAPCMRGTTDSPSGGLAAVADPGTATLRRLVLTAGIEFRFSPQHGLIHFGADFRQEILGMLLAEAWRGCSFALAGSSRVAELLSNRRTNGTCGEIILHQRFANNVLDHVRRHRVQTITGCPTQMVPSSNTTSALLTLA